MDRSRSSVGVKDNRFYDPISEYRWTNDPEFKTTTWNDSALGFVAGVDSGRFYAQQNMLERMYAAWEAATAISGNSMFITAESWANLELRMEWWFKAGKLDVTGDVYENFSGGSFGDNTLNGSQNGLKSTCKTFWMDPNDKVTIAAVKSSLYAIQAMKF